MVALVAIQLVGPWLVRAMINAVTDPEAGPDTMKRRHLLLGGGAAAALGLGAYAAKEKGVTFPHFFPPLWIVPYLEEEPMFKDHRGSYATASFGPWRRETSIVASERFERDPLSVRAQFGLGLAHGYLSIETKEVADFFAGIPDILGLVGVTGLGADLSMDDEKLDPTARREPARQLGRGFANIVGGALEIPVCMINTNKQRGDFAGATTGLAQGVWRFAVREVVGVVEVFTFPMGWEPIVDPEYPLQPVRTTDWDVRTPAFMRRL